MDTEQKEGDFHVLPKFYSTIVDEVTGMHIEEETQRLLLDEVLMDALKLTKLPEEMKHVKEMFRSRLLNLYTRKEHGDDEVGELVSQYTELRFQGLRLNPKFVDGIRGPHATYYLRMLREQIAEELELSQEVESPKELEWEKFYEQKIMEYDAESAYNLLHLSNTDAVGVDKLEERAANID